MWDLSLAQPRFLHIPHSAWDTDCSLKKILLHCWTSMCKIYHGGVRNFNLCFQNTLAAGGPKWGVSEIPHSFLLCFFFFFFGWTLQWQDYLLHSGYSIFSAGYVSRYVDVSWCVKIHGAGRGCQKCSSKCCLILGNSCVPVPTEGMPENNWRSAAPKTGRSAGLCWLQRSQQRSSISWCRALEPWPSAQRVGMNASPEWGGTSPVWVSFLWTQ